MEKTLVSGRLQVKATDPVSEKAVAVNLSDLVENAPANEIRGVANALQPMMANPIDSVRTTFVHEYLA